MKRSAVFESLGASGALDRHVRGSEQQWTFPAGRFVVAVDCDMDDNLQWVLVELLWVGVGAVAGALVMCSSGLRVPEGKSAGRGCESSSIVSSMLSATASSGSAAEASLC